MSGRFHILTLRRQLIFWKYTTVPSFRHPIRMQYVVNFTSMQYMSTSVDTGAEGMSSTTVACGVKPGCRL